MKKAQTNRIILNKIVLVGAFFVFLFIIGRLSYISLAKEVDGINLKEFADKRDTSKQILYANRGTIYSSDKEPLAFNIDSYTVIAYLSKKRSEGFKTPQHVIDKQSTAEALSPILNMEVETLVQLLSRENVYQVELGPGGKGITEMTKEKIEALKLPGISFLNTHKRYYPNHDFLSYTLGYSKKYDEELKGEMGIELFYNEELKGKNGYLEYQKDVNGYKIPNTPEIKKEEVNGNNIYLTIDSNIQMFIERIIKESMSTYNPEWMTMMVVEAKTGRILGTGSSPSFDPNIMNIESYLNPLVSYAYEPGSTMKIFTYLNAIEKGTFKGNDTVMTGNIKIGEDTVYDWNVKGWGTITYNQGFTLSSNVAVSNLVQKYINSADLKDFYTKLGFGSKTGITLPGELSGKINFKYPIEVANAGFGQGITITPIQYLKALTVIGNDGIMLEPYIVDKIVNPNTNKVVYRGKKKELGQIASRESVNQIKELMYQVVNGDPRYSTGTGYKIVGYDIIGKTGTAQYVNTKTGKYYDGNYEYIRSFAGLFPKDNPEIMVYTLVKRPINNYSQAVSGPTKKLITDVATYMNIFPSTNQMRVEIKEYKMGNWLNKEMSIAKSEIESKGNQVIVIGNGTKIINQYPTQGTKIDNTNKIFLLTNGTEITMENLIGYAKRDASTYCNLAQLECQFNGFGYILNQSIPENTIVKKKDALIIELGLRLH